MADEPIPPSKPDASSAVFSFAIQDVKAEKMIPSGPWWTAGALAVGLFLGAGLVSSIRIGEWVRTPSVVAPVDLKPVEPKLSPAPIAVDGLTVLIVEETGTRKVPFGDLIADPEWLKWKNENCAKMPDGTAAQRNFDPQQNLTNAFPVWQQAMKKVLDDPAFKDEMAKAKAEKRAAKEWLLVATPKGGYVGPLPTLEPKGLIEFLKPYAGIKPGPAVASPVDSPVVVAPVIAVERDCENCGGTGTIRRAFRRVTCPVCEGTGKTK